MCTWGGRPASVRSYQTPRALSRPGAHVALLTAPTYLSARHKLTGMCSFLVMKAAVEDLSGSGVQGTPSVSRVGPGQRSQPLAFSEVPWPRGRKMWAFPRQDHVMGTAVWVSLGRRRPRHRPAARTAVCSLDVRARCRRVIPGSQMATFSVCPHVDSLCTRWEAVGVGGRQPAVSPLLVRTPVLLDQGPTLMASFYLRYLIKGPVQIQSLGWGGPQHMNLEECGPARNCLQHLPCFVSVYSMVMQVSTRL